MVFVLHQIFTLDKEPKDLDIKEAAMLVGMFKNSSFIIQFHQETQ